jgi:phosphoribosylanthranilate isomerase
MTRIKICGLRRCEDALVAAHAGAHAVGMVFYANSPRRVEVTRAAEICVALPPFVTSVGLFVNPTAEEVKTTLRQVPLDLLQFHGDEAADFCAQFGRPYLKAVRMRSEVDLLQYAAQYRSAKALLVDAFVDGKVGGTGQLFDWRLIPATLSLPLILSGGLTPQNVAEGVSAVRPWAVDVSSGVESAPGVKDAAKIIAFIKGVRDADVRLA